MLFSASLVASTEDRSRNSHLDFGAGLGSLEFGTAFRILCGAEMSRVDTLGFRLIG